MRCTVRDKQIRTNRRARSVKPDSEQSLHHLHNHHHHLLHHHHHVSNTNGNSNGNERTIISRSVNYPVGLNDSSQNLNGNPNNNSVVDDNGRHISEEQLEDILLKNLELLYNEAISKLVGVGYDEEVALKAILRNGHCYGGMDVLTNIFNNSLAYLSSGNVGPEESEPVFSDLRQLEEYSLAGMICLLQQVRPHISKVDAMWSLLMSELHVGRASMVDIPGNTTPRGDGCAGCSVESGTVSSNADGFSNGQVGVAQGLCTFHGDTGFRNVGASEFQMNGFLSCASEMALQREIECPKRFNLSPTMKSLLKRNVAAFAAGFRANSKNLRNLPASLTSQDSAEVNGAGAEVHFPPGDEPQNSKNQDAVNSVLSKFRDLNLEENAENGSLDQKDEMILSLIHQIKELERQVKDRKEWAHQKALQAARKLSNDLTELKMLRMEREETQRLKKGKHTLEDPTMKRVQDSENALRKTSAQVDRANAAVRKLETENAELRAEMEAFKLSASESVTACLEVAKREKQWLKRLLAWEKQKTKLQEGIAAEHQKILDLQQELAQVEAAQKEAEVKWRQEQKAKEAAIPQVEEERRLKESAEVSNKRKLEALRLKIEIDFQRHKDDLQRLEQELSRLKASAQSTEPHHQTNGTVSSGDIRPQDNYVERHEFENLEASEKEASYDRECIICTKDEVSVVFLPCAHQVLCATCNENYGKKGKATCPCCRVPIEQRIRVFGASS